MTNSITARISSFADALRGGKLEWTTDELLPFILEAAGGAESTARSRAATIARTFAGALGIDIDIKNGAYVFGAPGVTNGLVPAIPSKSVSAPTKEPSSEVVFPGLPLPGKANPSFVRPNWYKRMAAALDAGKHVALAGPPGGGKSTSPEQYFIEKNQPFVVVNGDAGFRRRDMEGSVEVAQGATFFRVAEFAAAAVNGWGCILNEVNAADADALMYINGLLEVPFVVNIHGKAYPVHPDFRLVVTYNPGLIGTKPLPQAFKDRFFPIKLGFPPRPFLRKMVVAKTGVAETAPYLDRLLKYASDCWALHEKGNLRYQISPRRLFDAVWLMERGIVSDLDEAIKVAIVDSVDSAADQQMLVKLITSPMAEIEPTSQYA